MSILKKYIRKSDIVLFFALTGIGLFISVFLFVRANSTSDVNAKNAKVAIKSGGSVYAVCALNEERTFIVPSPKQNKMDAPAPNTESSGKDNSGGSTESNAEVSSENSADSNAEQNAERHYDYYNVVIISGGTVVVSEASCKNQVCVKHSAISKPGESIVCLPNRLTVNIEKSGEDSEEAGGGYDSITS